MDASLKIVIVDESPIRAAILEEGLREAGYTNVVRIDEHHQPAGAHLRRSIPTSSSSTSKTRAATCSSRCSRSAAIVKRPIAMFVDQSDTRLDPGVGRRRRLRLHRRRAQERAHQVHPRPVHLALQRVRRLQTELEQTKSALEERKVIDRAKGILMKAKNLSEEAGLRAAAQDRHEREQARSPRSPQSVITAAELFK